MTTRTRYCQRLGELVSLLNEMGTFIDSALGRRRRLCWTPMSSWPSPCSAGAGLEWLQAALDGLAVALLAGNKELHGALSNSDAGSPTSRG